MGGGLAGRYREIKRERETGGQTDRQDRTGQDRTGSRPQGQRVSKKKKKKKNARIFTKCSFPKQN